jgi:hypothetical protein
LALTVSHPFTSAVADSGDSTLVQPSNWNANHTVAGFPATLISGNSGAVDSAAAPTQTLQVLTSANSDIPTTTPVTQLTATGVNVGWWLAEYWIVWQSNVTTTGITFICDHTGTAANSQYTREDMTASTTALATGGISNQAAPSANSGAGLLPSNYSGRTDASVLGPNTGVDIINVNQLTRITGLLLVTGTGNLILQANSEIASTVTRVSAGTTARYTRLS